MLYFTRWKALAIILTALVVCLFAVPNFFPQEQVKTWPVWAQRHIVLGLDLQGGSYLLLEVDSNYVKKEKLDQVRDEVRRVLRDAKIGYHRPCRRAPTRSKSASRRPTCRRRCPSCANCRSRSAACSAPAGSAASKSRDAGGGLIRLTVPQAAITERIRQTIEQSIQIVERRVNELGTVEPLIQRQGADRILVQVPGLQDPTRAEAHRSARPPRWNSAWSIRRCRRIRPSRAGCRPDSEVLMSATVAEGALRHQEAGAGFRRRPHRRAAGLRPAHQRADRQLQVQHVRARANSRRRRRRMSGSRLRSSSTTR